MANAAGAALTRAHRLELSAMTSSVQRAVARVASTVDTSDVDAWWTRVAPRVELLVSGAARVAAAAAERYLAAHGRAHDVEVRPVRGLPDPEQVATALRVTAPVAWKQAFAASGGDAGHATATMRTALTGAAVRLALAGDRLTMLATISAQEQAGG